MPRRPKISTAGPRAALTLNVPSTTANALCPKSSIISVLSSAVTSICFPLNGPARTVRTLSVMPDIAKTRLAGPRMPVMS